MSADLRGTHDLGEVVGYAYRVYLAHFRTLFVVALITAPLAMLSIVLVRQIDNDVAAFWVDSLFQIPELLITLIAVGALITAVHDITGGSTPSPGDALDAGFQRFGAMLTSALLLVGLAVVSVFSWPALAIWWLIKRDATIDGRRDWWLVLIPLALTFYLLLRWGFIQQAVVIEDKRNWAALDASAGIVRGNWWRAFGILVVVALIQIGPVLLASSSALAAPIVEALVTALVSALILPFAIIAQTLLYYDLKTRSVADASPA